MTGTKEDPLCLVFIPALVTLLHHAERTFGAPLTEAQVLAIRDNANCIALPYSLAAKGEADRGYPDIVAENCWQEWQTARRKLFAKDA